MNIPNAFIGLLQLSQVANTFGNNDLDFILVKCIIHFFGAFS